MQQIKIPIIKGSAQQNVKVLAIEGCNGVGKTTLLNTYSKLHPDTECTLCVPQVYQTAKDMKHFMLYESSALCSALYYLGGAVEVKRMHNPTYSKILFDRSVWSTFAAAYTKEESIILELFDCLETIKQYVFIPNHIVVLEASYITCRNRIAKKSAGSEFDKDSYNQFVKKIHFYKMLANSGYPISFIDVNELTEEEVYQKFNIIANSFFEEY